MKRRVLWIRRPAHQLIRRGRSIWSDADHLPGEHALIKRNRKFVDSPLEGSGFEPSVPLLRKVSRLLAKGDPGPIRWRRVIKRRLSRERRWSAAEKGWALWSALKDRFAACKLALHPEKTKIVYCEDANRRGDFPNQSFDFLGCRPDSQNIVQMYAKNVLLSHAFLPMPLILVVAPSNLFQCVYCRPILKFSHGPNAGPPLLNGRQARRCCAPTTCHWAWLRDAWAP